MSYRPQGRNFNELDQRFQQQRSPQFSTRLQQSQQSQQSHHPSHPPYPSHHGDIEAVDEVSPPRLPERSSSGRLFMILMCFSSCICMITVVGACFLIPMPTDRQRDSAHPVLPHMSTTMVRIMQLKTHDDDENRLDMPVMQTLFPEWRSAALSDGERRFNVDRVLSDLIVAVRELARHR